jgi:hypothetical protein
VIEVECQHILGSIATETKLVQIDNLSAL